MFDRKKEKSAYEAEAEGTSTVTVTRAENAHVDAVFGETEEGAPK